MKGGVGYAYEFAGSAIEALSMEERMTLCNMAIEGGARCGHVNPDQVTFDYLKGRAYAPLAGLDRAGGLVELSPAMRMLSSMTRRCLMRIAQR